MHKDTGLLEKYTVKVLHTSYTSILGSTRKPGLLMENKFFIPHQER